jgi:hypothetical protein
MNPLQFIQLIHKVVEGRGTHTELNSVLEYFHFEYEEKEYFMMCSLLIQIKKERESHPKSEE